MPNSAKRADGESARRIDDTGIRRRLRERALASDRRAGTWARSQARQQQYQFIRTNWWLLAQMALLVGGMGAVALALLPGGIFRAYVAGLLTAGTAGAIAFWVAQATGTTSIMMGDLAEQWTAGELRKLRRRGWRVVNHMKLRTWDIDHVFLGPGGVYAIETKWSAQPWELAVPSERVRDAAVRAAGNARDLRMWHELKSRGITEVTPVVILWGAADEAGVSRTRCGDTLVLHGKSVPEWRDALPTTGLTPDQVKAAWQALDTHLQKRDPRDQPREHVPPSITTLALRLGFLFLVSVAAIWVIAAVIDHSRNQWLWLSALAVLTAAGVVAARFPRLRPIAAAWLGGLSASIVVFLVYLLRAIA